MNVQAHERPPKRRMPPIASRRQEPPRVPPGLEEGTRRGQVTTEQSTADLVMAFWSFQEGVALTSLYEASELPMERVLPIWRAGVRALLRP